MNPFVGTSFTKYNYADQMRGVFGGNKTFIDPYTTGYHVMVITPPSVLASEYGSFLTTVCQSVTIPGYTVETIEYNGINNKKWYVPGTVNLDSQRVTCRFVEMANLPITQIIGQWITIFRNVIYGISSPDVTGYTQSNYKGSMIYATTLPDHKTIQYAAAFVGVFPLKIPTDKFSSDRATQEKVEHDIEFSFDDMYTGENVISTANSLITSIAEAGISATDEIFNEAVSGSTSTDPYAIDADNNT